MIPLRAVHKTKLPPFVTRLLVTLNVIAFGIQLLLGQGALSYAMGVKPRCYFSPSSCGVDLPQESAALWQPLIVSLFLHGGWLHLAFNMLFLWVFGPGLEERLGKMRFLLFYLGCGVVASLAHVITHPFSPIPVIGASGAISGVLGAYLILLTRSWILTYFPPIFLFPVPAPLFIVLWMLSQIASALHFLPQLTGGTGSEIAWMAHIGGFAIGAFIAWGIKPWWKSKSDVAVRA